MRFILCICIGLICTTSFSQTISDQSFESLTIEEVSTLNAIYGEKYGLDFKGKKVAFTVGTTGTQIEDKSKFFIMYLNPVVTGKNVCSLIILTSQEKIESGGFDAVIMSPAKLFTQKHREFLISELKEKNGAN
jgi:hypothetical protein